jgi:ATP-dependent Clp protease ATP-binding subunit ClpA
MKNKKENETMNLRENLKACVIGQDENIDNIIPYIQTAEAGLSPVGRPMGVFMLAGPTGVGKTHTVNEIARLIHNSPRGDKHVLRIDCGEFQLEHEVAKLIGAPPGYLGHRETQPMINQQKINAVASERSNISIILFDEIEKAAESMKRILLGVLDRASMKLGDNTAVNFERCLIFFTSNAGAEDTQNMLRKSVMGFTQENSAAQKSEGVKKITQKALENKFAPEFMNRIDEILSFNALSKKDIEKILSILLKEQNNFIHTRLGAKAFTIVLSDNAAKEAVNSGFSSEYGARNLKRFLQKQIFQKINIMAAEGTTHPGGTVHVSWSKKNGFSFKSEGLRVKKAKAE